jgi:excisionase family DNA binding protein
VALERLSPTRAAESLNVSRSAARKWIEQGKLATERHGTCNHIPLREVERFRAERIRGIASSEVDVLLNDWRCG